VDKLLFVHSRLLAIGIATLTADLNARVGSRSSGQSAAAKLSRVTAQGRKDLTRADIVIGAMLRLQAQTNADKKQYRDNLIKGVEERDRYLFPEIWPKAVRVVRKRPKTEEAVAPAAGKS
jgi:hypothetical protein